MYTEPDVDEIESQRLQPSPCPSPRPSPRVNRKIFLNRLDTIDTLDPFYEHGSMKGKRLNSEGELVDPEEDDVEELAIEVPDLNQTRPCLQRGLPLESVDEDCSEAFTDGENQNTQTLTTEAKDDEPKTPSSRKSVTFSADLENVEELVEEPIEGEAEGETGQNDVFSDESTCLLGPEFEGIEPTYV